MNQSFWLGSPIFIWFLEISTFLSNVDTTICWAFSNNDSCLIMRCWCKTCQKADVAQDVSTLMCFLVPFMKEHNTTLNAFYINCKTLHATWVYSDCNSSLVRIGGKELWFTFSESKVSSLNTAWLCITFMKVFHMYMCKWNAGDSEDGFLYILWAFHWYATH